MIVTQQKSFDELLKSIGKGPVFLIGCSECATLCHTGGEQEVLIMKRDFEEKNIQVSGWIVLDPACHLQNTKRLLKTKAAELKTAKKVLVLACGNGVQTVTELLSDGTVVAGTDTLFLGEIKRVTEFEKRCILCGECLLDIFGGLCPVSRCPKSMLNGPCGGTRNGKCEVDSSLDCIWTLHYQLLKEQGKLSQLKMLQQPKNWSKATATRRTLSHD